MSINTNLIFFLFYSFLMGLNLGAAIANCISSNYLYALFNMSVFVYMLYVRIKLNYLFKLN